MHQVDCTVGSALDIFGGSLSYKELVAWHYSQPDQRPLPPPVKELIVAPVPVPDSIAAEHNNDSVS